MAERITQEQKKKKKVSKNIQIGIAEAKESQDNKDENENEEEEPESSQPPQKKVKVDVNDHEESEKNISVLLSVTPEKLKEQLCAGGGDIILINEELSGFLQTIQSHRSSSGSYKDDFGNYFGASEIRYSTCKGGTMQQGDPRLNVIGYIQPIPLLEIMEKKENVGFWHRWLFLCPERVLRRFKVMRELQAPAGPQLDLKDLLMISSGNACLRNSLEAQKNEKNLPAGSRFTELSVDATFEKKRECAELGMVFTIQVEDVEMAYNLVKFSDICYETFRDVATETENNSARSNKSNKGVKKDTTVSAKKTLDDPDNETSDYIFKHKGFISRLYKEVEADGNGKCKFSMMSTKKIFPNVSVKGKSAVDKLNYFSQVLHKFEVIKKLDTALFTKMTPDDWDDLSDDGKKIWASLYTLTKDDEPLDPFQRSKIFDVADSE